MTITENPKPLQILVFGVLLSPGKPQKTKAEESRLLSLLPALGTEEEEEEEEEQPSTELTLATATPSPTFRCPQEDEVSLTLTLGLPSLTSKMRKAVDQNPADDPPINPKRQAVLPLKYVDNNNNIREWRERERDDHQDPWEIKKRLTTSDLGDLCRLLVSKKLVEKHILPHWDDNVVEKRVKSKDGYRVRVHDCDTNSTHQVVFKFLESSESYVFNNNWREKFVKGRNLLLKDKIGLYWDAYTSVFKFSVLERANQTVVDHEG